MAIEGVRRCFPEVRAAVTPKINADSNIGEWDSYDISLEGGA